jgi:hypothetical protein
MARNKQYKQEVIEKRCLYSGAMGIKILVRMLKRGINQFSIYASFETNMAFSESLKCYKTKIYSIFEKLQNGKR